MSSQRPDFYTHEPLPTDRSIRLIQLVPDLTEPHSFSLTLNTVNLDDDPVFCALSYTKQSAIISGVRDNVDDNGPPTGVYVTCHGKKLAVSENAFDFLCQMFRDQLFLTTAPEGDSKSSVAAFASSHSEDSKAIPLRHIWIDGISTNQKDVIERSSQVFLRGDIFKKCRMTIAWLGKEEAHPGVLWVSHSFIPLYLRFYQEKGDGFFASKDPGLTDPEIIERLGQDVCSRWRQEYRHFYLFLVQRRWFIEGRSVQDVVSNSLGKSKITVMLSGSSTMCWGYFNRFMSELSLTGWQRASTYRLAMDQPDTRKFLSAIRYATQKLHVISSIQRHIRQACRGETTEYHAFDCGLLLEDATWASVNSKTKKKQETTDTRLESRYGPMAETELAHALALEVLSQMRGRHFLDKRDVIYGSYSLASQAMPTKAHHVFKLAVNYQLPVTQVYIQAAWSILQNTPYLALLGTVARADTKKLVGLPSWVPDFSVSIGVTRLNIQPPGTNRPNYDASKTRSPTATFRLLRPGNALQLRGIKISTISHMAPRLQGPKEQGLDLGWFLGLLLQYHHDQTIANPYSKPPRVSKAEKPPTISPTEALTRALFADGFPAFLPATHLPKASRKWWAHRITEQSRKLKASKGAALSALAGRFAGVANPTNDAETWFPSLTELQDMGHAKTRPMTQQAHQDSVVMAALDSLILRIWGNQSVFFFRSSGGRFGLGTSFPQIGDEVWLLEGGQTPFILRKEPAGGSGLGASGTDLISFFSGLLSGESSGSRYHVLGEAYVQGVMYGELVDTALLRRMEAVVLV